MALLPHSTIGRSVRVPVPFWTRLRAVFLVIYRRNNFTGPKASQRDEETVKSLGHVYGEPLIHCSLLTAVLFQFGNYFYCVVLMGVFWGTLAMPCSFLQIFVPRILLRHCHTLPHFLDGNRWYRSVWLVELIAKEEMANSEYRIGLLTTTASTQVLTYSDKDVTVNWVSHLHNSFDLLWICCTSYSSVFCFLSFLCVLLYLG